MRQRQRFASRHATSRWSRAPTSSSSAAARPEWRPRSRPPATALCLGGLASGGMVLVLTTCSMHAQRILVRGVCLE
jgi:hypothetical protein